MTIQQFYRELIIPHPIEDVFPFFSVPENLSQLTPPFLGFTILTPAPIVMEKQALIDYELRIMGIPTRWTTLITDYTPPHRFIDQQLKGPYSFWHHTHTFESVPGGTKMTDTVRYVVPFGVMGQFALPFVRWMLQRIFDYRTIAVKARFKC